METGRGARFKALGAGMHFYRWEESGHETKHGQAWRLFRYEVFMPYGRTVTLLWTKKPTTVFVFWPRLEIHVSSGPDWLFVKLSPAAIKTNTLKYPTLEASMRYFLCMYRRCWCCIVRMSFLKLQSAFHLGFHTQRRVLHSACQAPPIGRPMVLWTWEREGSQ